MLVLGWAKRNRSLWLSHLIRKDSQVCHFGRAFNRADRWPRRNYRRSTIERLRGPGFGYRLAMGHAADELLLALAHGLEGWMLGNTTDAVEIATFADTTGHRAVPRTPQAVEQLLEDMVDAGLVHHRSRQPSKNRWTEIYSAYGLTEEGGRARELDAE